MLKKILSDRRQEISFYLRDISPPSLEGIIAKLAA